jgi:hypothetical protein
VPSGAETLLQNVSVDARGKQITVSEGHQWPPPVSTGGQLIDRGGPFYTTKSYVASPRVMPYVKLTKRYSGGGFDEIFKGTLLPPVPGLTSANWDALYPPLSSLQRLR